MEDGKPYTKLNLLEDMELACDDTGEEMCQAWVRHTRVLSPAAWQGQVQRVMWMKCCGLTQLKTG